MGAVAHPFDLIDIAVQNAFASLDAQLKEKIANIDATLYTITDTMVTPAVPNTFDRLLSSIPVLPIGPLQLDLVKETTKLDLTLESIQATTASFHHTTRELHIEGLFDEAEYGLPANANLELQACFEVLESLSPSCFPYFIFDNSLVSKVLEYESYT